MVTIKNFYIYTHWALISGRHDRGQTRGQTPGVLCDSPNLGRHVEHQGHHGGGFISVDDEAQLLEPPPEIYSVLRELSQTVPTWEQINKQT